MLEAETENDGHGEHYEAIILGAGVSGLVSASVLLQKGHRHVLVVDTYSKFGGNHIDWSESGYTFDVGSFIFQDDSPLLQHFPELLPRYKVVSPTWGRLNPQGIVTAYPISIKDDIIRPGLAELMRICSSAIYARLFQRTFSNAREFARYWIGSYLLYSSGLESYMKRFYGLPPDEIDIELAQKRMLWISENASFLNLVQRRLRSLSKRESPANRQLVRPKEGFNYLYEAAAEKLREGGVTFLLGTAFRSLNKVGSTFTLRLGDRTVGSDRIISTIPVDHVQAICGLKSERLQNVTLVSLFFSFSGERRFAASILYNFSHQGAWKRLTMHSDFYGQVNGREYFSVEVIADHVNRSTHLAEQDFIEHVRSNGLFAGELKLEGSMLLENAYPIYTKQSGASAARAIRSLEDFGIESFGRQGGFNYQPTARVSTLEAEASLARETAQGQ
jgi:protoporphyrinogen oxidase